MSKNQWSVRETHDGQVRLSLTLLGPEATWLLTRKEAMLLALDLQLASSPLGVADIAAYLEERLPEPPDGMVA